MSLTKEEAIISMDDGHKVAHSSFCGGEYVMLHSDGRYIFEDSCRCSQDEFWRYRNQREWFDGWSIVHADDPKGL